MTDNEIIIEAARLDGKNVRLKHGPTFKGTDFHPTEIWVIQRHGPDDEILWTPTSYLTSRDAIVPVIEKCCIAEPQKVRFMVCLEGFENIKGQHEQAWAFNKYIKATPRQLCIALLKATGKWKE